MKSIRSIFYSALLAGATLCLTGCLPEERFWWAPDGSQAAVVTEDQLRLVDATGALLAKMEVPEEWRVVRVEWLPDSRVFLLQSVQEVESWGQVTALVPRDEANQVLALSAEVPALLRVAEILDGDVGKSEDPFVRLGVGEADLFRNALTLGLKKEPETVIPALEKFSREGGAHSDWREDVEHFAIHRVDRVSLEELALPEQPLLASLRLLGPCRLSPSGEKLLFGRRHGRGTTVELVIHDLGDGAENLVTKRAFSTYEWESESSLVTLVPVGQGETLVKQVHRYHLAEGSKAKREPLATAWFLSSPPRNPGGWNGSFLLTGKFTADSQLGSGSSFVPVSMVARIQRIGQGANGGGGIAYEPGSFRGLTRWHTGGGGGKRYGCRSRCRGCDGPGRTGFSLSPVPKVSDLLPGDALKNCPLLASIRKAAGLSGCCGTFVQGRVASSIGIGRIRIRLPGSKNSPRRMSK